jgi:GT2 family glycosyltransferase
VIKAVRNIDGEIIVIDNHSSDDSFAFFQNEFPEVHFIWNKENVGFAKANNQGLAIAKGENILFLNPDTIVPEDCFEKCVAFINRNNCALGIKMLDGSGNFLKESKRAFPAPGTSLFKLFGLAKLFPHSKIFGKYHLGYLNENENHEVDVLAGAFIMVPKKILDTVGGFDEDFFMYGEDIDLSFRIQKAGFRNFYFSESSIIHFKGESTKKGSLNYVKMFYKAMSIFVKKHYGNNRSRLFRFFIHVAIITRASFSAVARLLKLNRGEQKTEAVENGATIIAGSLPEYNEATDLLIHAGMGEDILGRIETGNEEGSDGISSIDDLENFCSEHPIKRIIFCEGALSFKEIIEAIQRVPKYISVQLFATGGHAIIGSDDRNIAGSYIFKSEESAH